MKHKNCSPPSVVATLKKMVAKTESSPKMTHALSVVSQKYDIDGDGKLDAAEKAL